MLNEADKLLIAAGVDGSLPPYQASLRARLLTESAEARALAERLSADRRRLAGLPKLIAPVGFADRVDGSLPIVRPLQYLPSERRQVWLPYVMAASVFVAITVGAFRFAGNREHPPTEVATRTPAPQRPTAKQLAQREEAPRPAVASESPPVARRSNPAMPEKAPLPRPVEPPALLAAGLFREIEAPTEVAARLPLLGPASDLDSPDSQKRTTEIWAALPAVRIDLFVPDVLAALPAVQAAARGCGWTISTDSTAQTLLKTKQPATFALYTDAVTAAEGNRFLAGLATQQKGGAKLGLSHLSAVSVNDLRELKELFGGDPKPHAKDSTVDQVVKKLTPKSPALVFAVSPVAARPAAGSKELRVFAEGRSERKPGSIPLLVIVRPQE